MKIKNSPEMLAVFEAVARERLRQKQLFYDGKILFNCDSPVVDSNRKLRVLVEEVGEVAQAIDCIEYTGGGNKYFQPGDLKTELVQVAAVAVAWLEQLEKNKP